MPKRPSLSQLRAIDRIRLQEDKKTYEKLMK